MRAAKCLVGLLASVFCIAAAGPIAVVATTSIVGDVVKVVGGDRVSVVVLFPAGTDPHTFEPTPRDLVVLARADVVFINGAGLEEGLTTILESPELQAKAVDLSSGLSLRTLGEDHDEDEDSDSDPHEDDEEAHGHDHGGRDPHVWFDPLLVAEWTRRIETALGALDPSGEDGFAARAEAYRETLEELDSWIQAEVAAVPPERRLLVTDHWVLGYFADRYGFDEAGAIIPSFSTLAEPSAKELAALVDQIRSLGVPAVFVSQEFNPSLATQLARDTGVRVVVLFHGSLSAPDGPAPDYLSFMRENVRRIVEALRG